jgi:hypothetical protein
MGLVSRDTSFSQTVASGVTSRTAAGVIANNSARILIAHVTMWNATTPGTVSCTWNSVSMTPISALITNSGNLWTRTFGLIAPDVGSFNLVGSSTNSVTMGIVGLSLYNADQTTGWQNGAQVGPTTDTNPTATVTSADGNYVSAAWVIDNGTSITIQNGTQDYNDNGSNGSHISASRASTSASTQVSFTQAGSVAWIGYGVDVIAAISTAKISVPNLSGMYPKILTTGGGRAV